MLVLIVDDEPVVAQTLGIIFSRSGFTTRIAHSAADALEYAVETPPDLVLCDFEMPDRDGLALVTDLCERLPNCRILVLTGAYGSLARIVTFAKDCGNAVNVLTKPCRPAELLHTAHRMLAEA